MNKQFISAALFLRELRAREIQPRLTRKIQEAGKIVEISLVDHVIVGAVRGGLCSLLQLSGGGAFMNDPHDCILQRYFWDFVDRGTAPTDTPLFTGIQGGEPLAAVIARELGLAPHAAESAVEIARKEVAL